MSPAPSGARILTGAAPTEASQETELLSRITALLQGALPLQEVLLHILRGLAESLGLQRAELYMLDARARALVGSQAVLHRGGETSALPPGEMAGVRVPLTGFPEVMSATVMAGKTHIIDDVREPDGALRLSEAVAGRLEGGAFAAVPLIAWGEVVGVIALSDPLRRHSLRQRLPLLNAFAVQAGLALERARLYEDRERALRELTNLQRTTSALQASLPLEAILQIILDGVAEGLDVDRAVLFLYEADRGVLRGAQAALKGRAEAAVAGDLDSPSRLRETIRGIEIPVGSVDEVMSATVVNRHPYVVDPAAADLDRRSISPALLETLRMRRFLTAPLLAQDRVTGVLTVDNFRREAPVHERLHLLMAYGAQAGLAIERTLLEEKVRASERKHREFLEESPDGIVESSLDGRILSCNNGILRLLGYTREELLSMNAREVYVDPSRRDELVRRNAELGHVEGMEIAVRRKDGSIAYVSASSRLREEAGEPVLECIIRDVTQRYEVERRARVLTDAVTYSADAIMSLEPGGRVTTWNLGAEMIFGYSAAEMIGRPYQTLVPQDLMEEFCKVIKARVDKEGHLQGFETERLHKDGRRIPVSLTVTRLSHNGDPALGWSVVVRDITERRREEQQRRLLSSITEQSPDAILSIDPRGLISSWNRGAEKMFGYPAAEIVGRPWLDLAPPEREADYRAVVGPAPADQAPKQGDGPRLVDTMAKARDGRLLPVRLSASVLRTGRRGVGSGEIGWSVILRDLSEQMSLAEKSERLQEELYSRNRLEGIVGDSRAMEGVRDRIRRVARFNSSVLLIGSSGTGKEIVANSIHYNSPRRDKPFIKVNCAAIPEHLLESELFGIERNVATGVDSRIGRFEMADGGTLFLDEIGDMTLATQAKILRVLQEREFERVGGKKVIKVDVRIIAATNKDLEEEIKARRFREDLYYRLNVIVISLPPLVDRREDVDPLIDHFLEKFARENDLPRKRLSLQARMLLNQYDWPGNVRELEHCIERAVVMGEGLEITEADLPPSVMIWKEMGGARPDAARSGRGALMEVVHQVERRAVLEALERCGWVQARAAKVLGISERSMWYRVKKLGLKRAAK